MTSYERQFRDAAENALQRAIEHEARGNRGLAAYCLRQAENFEARANCIATVSGIPA